jgi:hypothetical protein
MKCLYLAAALFVLSSAVAGNFADGNCQYGILKRREWGSLSDDDKNQYISALKRVMIRPNSNSPSFYDTLVKTHMDYAAGIHGYPKFLPWHRYYTVVLERELQRVSGQPIALPYWDWNKDSQAPELAKVWGKDPLSFGISGEDAQGCVKSGAFANYQVLYPSPRCLTRRWSAGTKMSALTSTDVFERILSDAKTFDQCRTQIEGPHGTVHVNIGGDMGVMNSPNDPIFFLHHANVDRLWNRWQVLHPDLANTYNGGNAKPTDKLDPYPAIVSDVFDTKRMCFQYRHFDKNGKSDSGEINPPVRGPPPVMPDPAVLGSIQKIEQGTQPEILTPDSLDRSDLFNLRVPQPLPDSWIKLNNLDPAVVRQCEQTVHDTVLSCNADLNNFNTAVLWNNDDILARLLLLHAQQGGDFEIKVGPQTVSVHVDPTGDQWLYVFRDQIKQLLIAIANGA